jgi:hypothetical protein
MRRIRPSYANVTATLALFVALSGGAYAAATLPANSVGSRQIKKSAVTREKVKNNAIDGSKVRDNSLNGNDVKESSLAKVPSAAAADHAAAAAALDKVSYKAAPTTAPPNGGNSATAGCDPGQHAVGGGVRVEDPINAFIVDDYPDAGNTAWTGRVGNASATPVNFTVYAICTSAVTVG